MIAHVISFLQEGCDVSAAALNAVKGETYSCTSNYAVHSHYASIRPAHVYRLVFRDPEG